MSTFRPDRRQRRTNPRVARHLAVFHRHVQVLADENPLAGQCEVGHLDNRHGLAFYFALTSATVVSSIRFENPHSLSYQAITLTIVPSMTLVSVAS